MLKKLSMIAMFLLTVTLVACAKTTYTVTFDSVGGSAVPAATVEEGSTVTSPSDPVKDDYLFAGWYETPEYTGDSYNFNTPVTKSFTLYAKWVLDEEGGQYVRFVDHRQNTTALVVANAEGKVTPPANPTRSGYRFGGWFSTKKGLTWNDTTPFDFTQVIPTGGVTVYAYWEPLNSKNHTWSDDETYFATLSSTTTYTLNPMTYEYSTDIQLIQLLSTRLYEEEVDWGKAIADGIAAYPGDFSKIGTGTGKFGIDLLKNHWTLAGAASYPKNQDGHDLVDEDGEWDQNAAANFQDTKWTVEIRPDMKFEDGRPITAADYVYTYKNYIDPIQNNKRNAVMFPTADRKNGYPVLNARSYFLQEKEANYFVDTDGDNEITWEDVGFKAIGDYTIEITFERAVAQTSAVGLMNSIYLVHPVKYDESLDVTGANSNYGTYLNPYVSYGPYIIKSWDNQAKLVLNKNYDYILRQNYNYKSMVYTMVPDADSTMQLFQQGKLSVASPTGDWAAQYAEWENRFPNYNGYPVSLDLNLSDAVDGSREANPIMKDPNFRKAFLYGFDRIEFTNTVFAPNTPSLMVWPIEAKQYAGDEFWYKDTQEHKEVLAALGLNEDTQGYNPELAYQYFLEAYNDWLEAGNTGKIIIDFIGYDNNDTKKHAQYIENHFEELFNQGGVERVDIQFTGLDDNVLFARLDNRAFDMAIDSSGWGHGLFSFIYMPLKGLFYNWLFGPDAGMNQPEDFDGLMEAEVFKPVDLRNTYEYLTSTYYDGDEDTPAGFWDDTTSEGTLREFYDVLDENDGYYVGTVLDLFRYFLYDEFIAVGDQELYSGQTEDLSRVTAAFEYTILDYVTLIPVASRTSVTIYAENVKVLWPEYSYELGWGTQRYRYLTTDPDFAA